MTKPHGHILKCSEGYSAFVPSPLPPPLSWTPAVIRAQSDADRLLGQLAGEGRRLPNPHILIRPFIKREAVYSSRIEGTQATLGELLALEAGASVNRSPDDLREVGNYVAALEYGVTRLKTLPLSLRLVKELHERLMKGVRGDMMTPGEFRRSQNWIGAPGSTLMNASYIPPPVHEMNECLGEWERFIHDRRFPPLLQAALLHAQFEAIHPFLDGNGRVGRLLITLFLIEREILPAPLLYLSAFFEATRRDYYARLLAITQQGEWLEWSEYFLNGVARQAQDALSRAERITEILERWREETSRMSSTIPSKLVDRLAQNPFLSMTSAARELSVAFTTIQRAVEQLEKAKIVQVVGDAKRHRVYCAQAILDILEEPARLVP
jgi:Fic family protein